MFTFECENLFQTRDKLQNIIPKYFLRLEYFDLEKMISESLQNTLLNYFGYWLTRFPVL